MPRDQSATAQRVPIGARWRNEANDFTPWLRDNIQELGDVIDLRLRDPRIEAPVGRFAVDILAEADGVGLVVIENQLNKSDHRHLGQLMTYAGGREAKVLVWIATEFHMEHLAAIDWLNEESSSNVQAYAVRVEAIRERGQIGHRFVVRSAPGQRAQRVARTPQRRGSNLSRVTRDEMQALGEDFFQRLQQECGDPRISVGSNAWFSFMAGASSGFSHLGISYTIRFRGSDHTKGTSVHLWIQGEDREFNTQVFDALAKDRQDIEAEFGAALQWHRSPPGGHACAIRSHGEGAIDDSPYELQLIRADLIERYKKLRRALDKRLPAAVSASG